MVRINGFKHRLATRAMVVVVLAVSASGCGREGRGRARVSPGEPRTVEGQVTSPRPAHEPPGIGWMVDHLDAMTRINLRRSNRYRNARHAEILKQWVASAEDARSRIRLMISLGYEQLLAGHTPEAIETLEQIAAEAGDRLAPTSPTGRMLEEILMVAYLRLGEQQNCIAHHPVGACVVPLQPSAFHLDEMGSREAIKRLSALLERDPDNLNYRWLLNIAHMTLGGYPDQVPERWRISADAIRSEHPLPPFPDVAPALGLDVNELSGSVVMDDFDNDGGLDLLVSSFAEEGRLHFFLNQGDGNFEDRTTRAGLSRLRGGLNMVQADYDNDGFVDVLVLRGAWMEDLGEYPNSLLRNNGDGTFEDVTREAGLLEYAPTQVAAWGDYDNDGWLDLFIGNEAKPHFNYPSSLYRNRGDGTFEQRSEAEGLSISVWVKGAVWGDCNNDGRLDLYVSTYYGRNKLFLNAPASSESKQRFVDVSKEAGVQAPWSSFPVWFWDFNNDGWQDILAMPQAVGDGANAYYMVPYVLEELKDGKGFDDPGAYRISTGPFSYAAAEYFERPPELDTMRLYLNRGDGTFDNVTEAQGLNKSVLAMGANYGDLDNDGFLDFYIGTGQPDLRAIVPNRMFRNAHGEAFQDVTTAGHFGHIQKGHGVAFGDMDNDGDQDIYAVMGGAFSGDVFHNVLFYNPGNDHAWITLDLEGEQSNRSAIGTRIRIVVQSAQGGTRDIHRTVSSGGSFGASSLLQEIGLGDAVGIESITITWPASGIVQTFDDVPLRKRYHVLETRNQLEEVEVTGVDFTDAPRAGPPHHHHH